MTSDHHEFATLFCQQATAAVAFLVPRCCPPAHGCCVFAFKQFKLGALELFTQPALAPNLSAQQSQPQVVHFSGCELPDDALPGAAQQTLEQVAAPCQPQATCKTKQISQQM